MKKVLSHIHPTPWLIALMFAVMALPSCKKNSPTPGQITKIKKERQSKEWKEFLPRLYRVRKITRQDVQKGIKNLSSSDREAVVKLGKEMHVLTQQLQKNPNLMKDAKHNEKARQLYRKLTEKLRPVGLSGQKQIQLAFVEALEIDDANYLLETLLAHLKKDVQREVEGEVRQKMPVVLRGQNNYQEKFKKFASTLEALNKGGQLEEVPGDKSDEYQYEMKVSKKKDSFQLTAIPRDQKAGWRGFYLDHTGLVRFTEDGTKPSEKSPVLK